MGKKMDEQTFGYRIIFRYVATDGSLRAKYRQGRAKEFADVVKIVDREATGNHFQISIEIEGGSARLEKKK